MKFFAHAALSPRFILSSGSSGYCSIQHIDIRCWRTAQILRPSAREKFLLLNGAQQEINLFS